MKKKLSELRPGDSGTVVEISGSDKKLRTRLIEMGINKGEVVKVIRNAPLRDPIEFELKGYKLSLKRKEADSVVVEVIGDDSSPSYGSGRLSSENSRD